MLSTLVSLCSIWLENLRKTPNCITPSLSIPATSRPPSLIQFSSHPRPSAWLKRSGQSAPSYVVLQWCWSSATLPSVWSMCWPQTAANFTLRCTSNILVVSCAPFYTLSNKGHLWFTLIQTTSVPEIFGIPLTSLFLFFLVPSYLLCIHIEVYTQIKVIVLTVE